MSDTSKFSIIILTQSRSCILLFLFNASVQLNCSRILCPWQPSTTRKRLEIGLSHNAAILSVDWKSYRYSGIQTAAN